MTDREKINILRHALRETWRALREQAHIAYQLGGPLALREENAATLSIITDALNATAGPASGSAPARPPETAPDPTSAPTPQTGGTDAGGGRR